MSRCVHLIMLVKSKRPTEKLNKLKDSTVVGINFLWGCKNSRAIKIAFRKLTHLICRQYLPVKTRHNTGHQSPNQEKQQFLEVKEFNCQPLKAHN